MRARLALSIAAIAALGAMAALAATSYLPVDGVEAFPAFLRQL